MPRLNVNQIKGRVRTLLATMGEVENDQFLEIMNNTGWLDRLVEMGAINAAILDAVKATTEEPAADYVKGHRFKNVEEARGHILQGLYERAVTGDAQSARAFSEIATDNAPKNRFEIEVKVVPADVPDKMLREINMQAAPFHVDEGLEGLETRMQIDEAPHDLRELLKKFRARFAKWCEVVYAPKDE